MILTLDDLRAWTRPGAHLAVIGHPIAHSLSPRMQNAALAALAAAGMREFAEWRYHKFDIHPDDLPEALRLFHERGFKGLNLTLPHKVLALPLIRFAAESGALVGAVNTLVPCDGGWAGHNTDGSGFARALLERFAIPLSGADVVLLGAGGSARAVATTALAAGCRSLHILNRSAGHLDTLVRLLSEKFPDSAGKVHGAVFDNNAAPAVPPPALPRAAVVVNATALGLAPGAPSPFPAALWAGGRAAFDIVYGTGETRFLQDARAAGVPACDGLSMLCWQGALALELWTGQPAPVAVMARALAAPVLAG